MDILTDAVRLRRKHRISEMSTYGIFTTDFVVDLDGR